LANDGAAVDQHHRRAQRGHVVATSIDFLGSTNPSYQGAVATTLSTPWNIIGNASIGFSPRFETSGEVTGPRLFDENDIGSILCR
jgi:hypothetical protein